MQTHRKFLIKGGIFALILILVLIVLTWVFLPKALFSQDWPDTTTITNFYKLKRDSVDVLFLGSSHSMTSFIPQVLYDEYGLTSYNLCTQQQNILVSYFWLKEALRFQHPEVVVLDTYFCFRYREKGDDTINSDEAQVRYAIDPMQWSPVKVEAIAAICENDEAHTLSSYYNPLERFHSRWTDLGEDDLTFLERLSYEGTMGYTLLGKSGVDMEETAFEIDTEVVSESMPPLMREYLNRFVALCEENSIALILVNTPYTGGTAARYNAMSAYAKQHGLEYIDFNEITLNDEIGYEYSADAYDKFGHSNYWGAQKLTRKIGEVLTGEKYGLTGSTDAQWETSREFFETAVQNAELIHITDFTDYLQAIDKDRYTVFIAVKDDASSGMDDGTAEALEQLGLEEDLRGQYRASYYAVISGDGVREEVSRDALSATGSFRGGRSRYEIESAGYDSGNTSSIRIDGREYGKNERGINIVVYDDIYHKVIDSVSFDTYSESLEAKR